MTGEPLPVEPLTTGALPWGELLHDWRLVSEHDGGYALLRCRVCGTDVVR